MDGLHRKAAKAHFLAGTDLMELCTGGKTVLLQLVFDQANGQTCSVNGHVELFEQIRQAADMVFVAMGNEQALDAVLIFQYIGEIRNDKVHAEHIGIREHQAAVHQDHIALAFIQGDVFANFAQAAQRADVHGNSRGGSIIIMLLIAAALRAAGALHRGRSCCIHRIARCSLLGLRGTAALRLAVLGLWFFRRCLRGAGRGGRRTGFAVLVIIICARGTAGVIAAALLAGAFFIVVIFHCITSILYSARVGSYTHGKHRTPDVMFCRM